MSLEYLKLAQLAAGLTRVQAAQLAACLDESQTGSQGSRRLLIGELAYEGHDVAVALEWVVESEGPDLEPCRLLQASRARERANREPAEHFVRLLDELLRPPDDSIEDSAVSAGDDGGGSH